MSFLGSEWENSEPLARGKHNEMFGEKITGYFDVLLKESGAMSAFIFRHFSLYNSNILKKTKM